MITGTFYFDSTVAVWDVGRIHSSFNTTSDIPEPTPVGCQLFEGTEYGDEWYIELGGIPTPTLRTERDITAGALTIEADGADTFTLLNLPIPCVVEIDGQEVLVEDGSLEYTTEITGLHLIVFDHAKYVRREWWVYAI